MQADRNPIETIRRRRPVQPKRMLQTLAVVWAFATAASSVLVDSHVGFRLPYVADLAEDYAKRTGPIVLAIGSSRTGEGIDVNRLTTNLQASVPDRRLTAYCATVSGSGLATQESILNALLQAGPKPEVVLLEVNPEFLDARKKWINITRDATWSNLFDLGGEALQKYGAKLAENRLLPLYSRRFEIRRFVWRWAHERFDRTPSKLDPQEPNVPILFTGFVPAPAPPEQMTEALRSKQIRLAPPIMKDFSPTGNAARALERMLAECQKRGVPVLMIDAALCSHSRVALEPSRGQYRDYLNSLLQKYPTARYDDASAALPDEAFRDHHHANAYGCDLLCQRLGKTILPAAIASFRDAKSEPLARIASNPEAMRSHE